MTDSRTPEDLEAIIKMLGDSPDSQLDSSLSKACREFSAQTDDPVIFLRNLRDVVVHIGGGSGFVMAVFQALLANSPEAPEANDRRIATLERNTRQWMDTKLFL